MRMEQPAQARVVPLAEVKELLSQEVEHRELSTDQRLSLEHAQRFAALDPEKARKLHKELLGIKAISEGNAAKIVDLLPQHPDDVRAIFAKERFTLDKKDVTEILELVQKYL